MGFCEEYINNKRLHVEIEMLEAEKEKLKALMDISECLMMLNRVMIGQIRACDNAIAREEVNILSTTLVEVVQNMRARWQDESEK